MGEKTIIVEFDDRNHFMKCLEENPGTIIIKFSATWCKPCQKIKEYVENKFSQCSDDVICCDLDVDENMDLYTFCKKNKQVKGIPSILAWEKGNVSPFADCSVTGIETEHINLFFDRYIK